MIRKACVSGIFYEKNKNELINNIENMMDETKNENSENKKIVSLIVPHAGYIYSGKTASYAYNEIIDIPETIIIIGPNHTGYGQNIDLTSSDTWQTPLGNIKVDTEFNEMLEKIDVNANFMEIAHIQEHSIEVELPFLQYISKQQNKEFKIVPIVISRQKRDLCINLAKNIKKVADKLNRNCIIIASTDLTHFEDSISAKNKDTKVLKSIKNMDIDELIYNINKYQITMCGYGPVITAISYSKLINANNTHILNYSNSGDTSGDYNQVVGYASMIITE